MAIEDKKFQSKETGDVVKIVNDSGVFYSLSNGINIRKDNFFTKFTEMVDASSFFDKPTVLYEDLASKINKIDTSKISDMDTGTRVIDRSQDSQIAAQTPTQSREDLLRQYNESKRPDVSQYKVFDDEEEAATDFLKKTQQPQQQRKQQTTSDYDPYEEEDFDSIPMDQGREVQKNLRTPGNDDSGSFPSIPGNILDTAEEQSFKFFKSFKRIHPIKLSIDFDERIADPAFIKMMSMNFEGDIIKYYTKEIMNRVQNDPGYLEDRIYNKLKTLIMGEEKPPRKTRTPKVVIPEPIVSEKKTRKPRIPKNI